jgi:hypothetical protein
MTYAFIENSEITSTKIFGLTSAELNTLGSDYKVQGLGLEIDRPGPVPRAAYMPERQIPDPKGPAETFPY